MRDCHVLSSTLAEFIQRRTPRNDTYIKTEGARDLSLIETDITEVPSHPRLVSPDTRLSRSCLR